MAEKQEIRARVLSVRESMDEAEWRQKTGDITEKVTEHPVFRSAREIYCYMDFRREVGTRGIIEKAWEMGKKVAIPRVEGERMEFYYISSFREVHPGRFGILEPDKGQPAPGREGLVLTPGAVFDRRLHRIGYGGGFYDRYLEEHRGLLTMAVAFEFQVLFHIPQEEHDLCPQILVTEEQVRTRDKEETYAGRITQRPSADAGSGEHKA